MNSDYLILSLLLSVGIMHLLGIVLEPALTKVARRLHDKQQNQR